MVVLGLTPFEGFEVVSWALILAAAAWAAARGMRWIVGRYGQDTRWGRRSRTRLGLRRARDGLLERYAAGELTEVEYRERLRVLEQEGRSGP